MSMPLQIADYSDYLKYTQEYRHCEKCEGPMIRFEHYEYDGVTPNGSYEPYYECADCGEAE